MDLLLREREQVQVRPMYSRVLVRVEHLEDHIDIVVEYAGKVVSRHALKTA